MSWTLQKKKQIGINHTREGIGRQGRLRANNRRGGGGGKARNTGVRKRNLSITITRNQSSMVGEAQNGIFIITASSRGSSSMDRRLRGHNREHRMTEVTDAGGPTRLSKVVAVSVVQGVEQVCAGVWEVVEGERAGHILLWKQAVTANIAKQRCVRSASGKPKANPQT
jgi:hypothetical protein